MTKSKWNQSEEKQAILIQLFRIRKNRMSFDGVTMLLDVEADVGGYVEGGREGKKRGKKMRKGRIRDMA